MRGRQRVELDDLEQACRDLDIEPFEERVHDKELLRSAPVLTTMQVNVGYRCNLACNHCFLESGPPEYHHFAQLYAECGVHLVTSLPYFNEQGCDLQRGRSVFDRVVKVLRRLNELGYGSDPALVIDVAYNVSGPFLPPDQRELEEYYAFELEREQHVKFNNLYAFNNYALGRFANQLKYEGKFDYYLDLLAENYNGAVVARMMCRSQVNVDFDGRLYDCEVNHVLGLPLDGPATIRDLVEAPLGARTIATSPVYYSCAAGCGSSCGGSLMDKYGD